MKTRIYLLALMLTFYQHGDNYKGISHNDKRTI